MTKNRIREWYEHQDGEVYVSFSGGKDSTVLKHIVDSVYEDVPSVFVNTGLEYPEVRQFALKQKNVIRLDPKMKFYDVVEKQGYPVVSKEQSQFIYEYRTTTSEKLRETRLNGNASGRGRIFGKQKYLINAPFKISHMCCHVMKKYPFKSYERKTKKHPMLGSMADESFLRKSSWLRYGCNAFERYRPISQPISFQTEQDVLQYIYENKLDIASVYGKVILENGQYKLTGIQRTGCMWCLLGVHNEPEPNRFQIMKKTHPKQYEYCMNNLNLKQVLEYMNVPYE